jgi:hypothetical protein
VWMICIPVCQIPVMKSAPVNSIWLSVGVMAREVFDSLVEIRVGDGAKTLFWRDRWLRGMAVCDHEPEVHGMVNTRCKNSRTVQQALLNHRWLNDIQGNLSPRGLVQCLVLLLMVSTFFRDSFGWPCSPCGQYTARSTYKRLCMGPER